MGKYTDEEYDANVMSIQVQLERTALANMPQGRDTDSRHILQQRFPQSHLILEVTPRMTIGALKSMIEGEIRTRFGRGYNFPAKKQRLRYGIDGQEVDMRDHLTLSHYNIQGAENIDLLGYAEVVDHRRHMHRLGLEQQMVRNRTSTAA